MTGYLTLILFYFFDPPEQFFNCGDVKICFYQNRRATVEELVEFFDKKILVGVHHSASAFDKVGEKCGCKNYVNQSSKSKTARF